MCTKNFLENNVGFWVVILHGLCLLYNFIGKGKFFYQFHKKAHRKNRWADYFFSSVKTELGNYCKTRTNRTDSPL